MNWWKQQLEEDVNEIMGGGYPTKKQTQAHAKKIKKLRGFLNKNSGKEFVYDFGNFSKTILSILGKCQTYVISAITIYEIFFIICHINQLYFFL